VVGGSHSRDPRWLAEEWVDDAETWGKMTAWTQGLARREESPTDMATQFLAGSEGAVAAYLGVGEKQQEAGSFHQPVAFIARRRERERGAWSHTSMTVARRLAGLARMRHGDDSPILGQTHMRARSV
jgi:hypothetical protein